RRKPHRTRRPHQRGLVPHPDPRLDRPPPRPQRRRVPPLRHPALPHPGVADDQDPRAQLRPARVPHSRHARHARLPLAAREPATALSTTPTARAWSPPPGTAVSRRVAATGSTTGRRTGTPTRGGVTPSTSSRPSPRTGGQPGPTCAPETSRGRKSTDELTRANTRFHQPQPAFPLLNSLGRILIVTVRFLTTTVRFLTRARP